MLSRYVFVRGMPLHMGIMSIAVRLMKSKQPQPRINPGFALCLPDWL